MIKSEFIQARHLERQAVVYLRQSSPQQVLQHQESLQLQYALTERARQYGWDATQIQVIDTDLGLTGSTSTGRPGFQELVTRVNREEVGIIFAYDVTRLARNCTDWYQLLDLCGYRGCLVGDQDGLYDPATTNGRLILGLKGLIAELELHTIKARLQAGLLNKARRGELALSLPVGLVRDLAGRVVKHADREVRDRLDLIFATFLRTKSIHGVVRTLATQKLLVPRRDRGRDDHAVVWRRATVPALSSLFRNPAYAGTYVYGRTRFRPRTPGGRARKCPLPPEQWQVVIPDKYPAYIDRETYSRIQAMLRDNYQEYARRSSRGPARSGAALLQGLAYCGHCGNKMTVQYHAGSRYICNRHKTASCGKDCQRVVIGPVDAWVVQNFWEALVPAELDRYDEAIAALGAQQRQVQRARALQRDRLRYEAQLAEKQFRLVDPENRLVAAELERRWEQALQALRQAEQDEEALGLCGKPMTTELRKQVQANCPSLRQMWDDGRLSNVCKKELLRTLIDKVVLKRGAADRCEVRIVWKGGDWTATELRLPVVRYAEMADGDALVAEVLRRAKAGQPDKQIATELTAAGYHAPLCADLSVDSVQRIRVQYGVYSKKTEVLRAGLLGWLTLGQAVKHLGEHSGWAYYLIRQKRLQIQRDEQTGLYLVRDNKKVLKALKELLRGKQFSLVIQPRLS
jgi:DNA invertase Pin-like site-specific DNA recombinase